MKPMIQTKTWMILFAALLALLIAAALLVSHRGTGKIANVYQDGVCIRSIDLSAVTEAYSFTVTDGKGHENLIEVAPGQIRVAEANCPDHVCVHTGWISDGLRPIVCLPARLSIQLEDTAQSETEGLDAVIG